MTPILEARGLAMHFPLRKGLFGRSGVLKAVDGVDLSVMPGETLAIVGESGCGKSTLARLLMRLLRPTAGEVLFDGRPIGALPEREMRALRAGMQMVFQDPFGSLNPQMTVGTLVGEPLAVHRGLSGAALRDRVAGLLTRVGLRPDHADRYPHEFSGGQRQRIGIARALASGPRLILGDEPVSALDVSVQAQIVNLLEDLKAEFGLTLVLIAHDLAVIRHMADRVAVMYLGRIVEEGPAEAVFTAPRHPYTRALIRAIPVPDPGRRVRAEPLPGDLPSPASPPAGCRFHTRCPHAIDRCRVESPTLTDTGGQRVACHRWREIAPDPVPAAAATLTPAAETRFALFRDRLARRGTQETTEEEVTE